MSMTDRTLLAGMLLSFTTGLSYGRRVVFTALMGMLPALTVEVPQNNWSGFPPMYVFAQSVTHVAGFIFAGLVVAWVVNPQPFNPKPVNPSAT